MPVRTRPGRCATILVMRNGSSATRRILTWAGAVVAAVVAATMALAVPAGAHTELQATKPADGASVTAPIDEVTLTFNGPVRADGSTVTITGPGGQTVQNGPVSVIDTVVHQPVSPLRSGAYQVDWRVVAADGHALTGQFLFQVNLPPELEPTTPASTPAATDQGVPTDAAAPSDPTGWWWVAGGALAVVLGAFLLWLSRRARRPR
jgi:methionine-rich copper-binding protein CopC